MANAKAAGAALPGDPVEGEGSAPADAPEPDTAPPAPAEGEPEPAVDTTPEPEPAPAVEPEPEVDHAAAIAAAEAEAAQVVGSFVVAVAIGGTRNGAAWPEVGELIDLPAVEAVDYLRLGYIELPK